MLAYFILGIGLFLAMLLMANWYASSDTKTVMTYLKWGVIGVIVGVGLFFLFTGRLAWAVMALPALLPWFMRLRSLARAAKAFSRMAGGYRSSNQTSDVETPTLRMTLDHASGEMRGEVLRGPFAGRHLEEMSEPELIQMLNSCLNDDEDAARLVESYLDRRHPSWRDQEQHAEGAGSSGATMDRSEAYKVLGLEEGAGESLIKEAHRRLIAGLHPDHGGSDYLAAKINQAKDVLLKG